MNSFSVALLILVLMYCWMNLPLNFIGEETCIKATVKIAGFFAPQKNLPYGIDDVMFIDVSHSSTLITDNFGTHAIADRAKLDTLFQLLRQHGNPNQIIVCDLYFDIRSEQDTLLQASMEGLPNLLSAVKTNWQGDISPNVFRAGTSGTSGFWRLRSPFLIFSNTMFKFHLTDENCVKTLPLLMYERLNNYSTTCLADALKIGGDWYFNTVLIDEELGRTVSKAVYEDQVLPIQHVVTAAKENQDNFAAQLRHKKFIMIGNFQEDVHPTTFGEKPGPMILFDVFLSLQQKKNMLSTAWVLMAVTFLTLLIYKKFYHFTFLKTYKKWLDVKFKLPGFERFPIIDWALFYLFVLYSAIAFHVYLELVAGLLFLSVISWTRLYLKEKQSKVRQLIKSGRRLSARVLFSFLFTKAGLKN